MSKTGSAQTAGFLPGNDQESVEANRKYQEALNRLTQSLDTRKNRFFDPVWLAAAQGFASAKTPDFFESLGPVAKNIAEAQAAQEKENRDIAQMQLDVAGRGLEMQRQKSLQSMAMRQMQGQQAGDPSGAPQGGQRGFQIAPPDPNRMTGQQYYALAIARGISPDEAMKGASQIDERNKRVTEGGLLDLVSGFFYPNKFEAVDYQIFGKTYKIPQGAAMELDFLARSGDEEAFNKAARSAIRDFQRPPAAQQGAPVAPQPAAAPSGQPAARPAAPQPVAPQAVAPQAAAPQAAAQSGLPAAPVVQPPIAAPVVAPVTPPTSAAPAQAANLVGGMFSPPTKNADDLEGIRQAVEFYQYNADIASGNAVTALSKRPYPPEAIAQAREQAAQTIERLNQRYGMRPVQAAAARPEAPAQVAPPTAPAAVQPAAPAAVTPAAPSVTAQAAPAARPVDPRMRSQQEMEIEQAQAKARAEAEVKKEIESREEISANAKRARDITATANVLRRMADAPDFNKMTGILSNDKWTSAMALLAREGFGGRNISIGIPGIEDAMRNARLNPDQQARFRTYLMYTAQMNLAAENTMKGQTTERERQILGNATISTQDTKETVRIKADLLNIKAQFDKRVANAFEDAKMTPREFYRSETYETMYKTYIARLEQVATGEMMLPPRGGAQPGAQRQGATTAPPARQGAGQPSVGRARDKLNELLNRRP
jgi:hypothetical protein